jgi:hypothetical protein
VCVVTCCDVLCTSFLGPASGGLGKLGRFADKAKAAADKALAGALARAFTRADFGFDAPLL